MICTKLKKHSLTADSLKKGQQHVSVKCTFFTSSSPVTTYMRNEGEGWKMSLYFDDTLDRTCVSTEFGGLKQMSPSPVGYVRYMGNEDTVQCMPQQGHFPSVNMKKKE